MGHQPTSSIYSPFARGYPFESTLRYMSVSLPKAKPISLPRPTKFEDAMRGLMRVPSPPSDKKAQNARPLEERLFARADLFREFRCFAHRVQCV